MGNPNKDADALHNQIEQEIYDPFSKLNRKKKRGTMSDGIKYKDPLEYTPKEFIEFKKRVGVLVAADGISCNECLQNAEYKNFIANYTNKHFIKDAASNILERYTYKLNTLTLGSYTVVGKMTVDYPVVQQFKGHFLVKTIYFAKGLNGEILVKEIYVKEKPIILV